MGNESNALERSGVKPPPWGGGRGLINERKEFMQEAQHKQQTAIPIAQNQDKETT